MPNSMGTEAPVLGLLPELTQCTPSSGHSYVSFIITGGSKENVFPSLTEYLLKIYSFLNIPPNSSTSTGGGLSMGIPDIIVKLDKTIDTLQSQYWDLHLN